jgi:amino acid adenylation domain-containing protein
VIVGSPIANRRRPELESLIGFFVNTLVLRTDLSGKPTFKEALARVREVCLGAYTHQDLPFEKLVEELRPERDASRNPLFQVMFALQNATRPFCGIPSLPVEPFEIESTRSPFDLSLFLRERGGKYIGYIEYSTDLFDAFTVERMADHFCTLLEGILGNPDRPISVLPVLTEAERHQRLVEWNDTAADYPKDKCIHELFEKQVERTPDAIALEFEGRQLNYRKLNERANQLANYLLHLGVGPETLVGICVERSLEMVVGLLGILKAGGAYVPLDPAYPTERLGFMVEDAQVSVVLTEEKFLGSSQRPAVNRRPTYLCIDRDWPVIEQESRKNPKTEVESNNLAYIIYTSGSTGKPKGVAIEHRNTINLLHWANTIYTAEEFRGVLASTSICFDLSIFELFCPLSWGGKVVLVENVLCLLESPSANEVTLINTVPSLMTALLSAGRLPGTVRVVNLAGEPLNQELVRQVYDSSSVEKVYDLYAPSETTTYSTFALRTAGGLEMIGRPISNTQVYVLDSQLQLVPVGVTGELYIGGAGVARGYLNRSELTGEKFISNPFSYQSGDRLYRTGDLARYLPDGQIRLLGRNDDQVKIRGYRIELGEVEAALNQHPAVKDSVVVARVRDSLNGESLVGYVVQNRRLVSMATQLRDYLRARLPDYMIPSVFVILDALPLAPNGKIDRNVLPAPDGDTRELVKEFTKPRTEIEELVAQTWREVLKLERVEIHDNFFDLGGHSLLAMRTLARLRDIFDREVPLRVFFEAPTVADLSKEIETLLLRGDGPKLPPITRVPRDGPLPLSTNQEHLWRLDQMIPGTSFFNMPYVCRLTGELNVSALEQTLREIIRRHEALRTFFAELEGHPVQVIKDVPDFQLPYIDLRRGSSDEVSQKAAGILLEERETRFDLGVGPLFKIKLLRVSDQCCLLLVTLHHIISDHWSMQIFFRELGALYEAFSRGQPSPLPELAIQFADVACWERRLLESGLMQNQIAFWKNQLRAPLSTTNLSKYESSTKKLMYHTSSLPIEVADHLFAKIKALANKSKCTPFMIVVAALCIVIHQATAQEDIRIGTLVANRWRKESEQSIGYFLNTIILRLQISPSRPLGEFLAQVREVTLAAYAHQSVPFEHLARNLEEEWRIDRKSLFEFLLSYQTCSTETSQLGGLTIASVNLPRAQSTLEVSPTSHNLIFTLREASTTLTGSVNYNTSIGNNVVTSIPKTFLWILESIVDVEDRMPYEQPTIALLTNRVWKFIDSE